MFRRFMCAMGLHWWRFSEYSLRGSPMRRTCAWCGHDQVWHYDLAREYGVIRWVDNKEVH